METKNNHKITISDKLYSDLKEYCELNNLKMVNFVDELLTKGLLDEKYGNAPFLRNGIVSYEENLGETKDNLNEKDNCQDRFIKMGLQGIVSYEEPLGEVKEPDNKIKTPTRRKLK